jgi:hypothetical protein
MIFFVLLLLALPGIALGVTFLFSAKRLARSLASVLAVMPVVVTIARLGWIARHAPIFAFSPNYLAREIQRDGTPIVDLRVSGLTRSVRYGLNFYLHREIADWDRDTSREVYVLTEGHPWLSCRGLPIEMNCSDLWIEQERLDTFDLLHLAPKPLPAGRPSGGKLQ